MWTLCENILKHIKPESLRVGHILIILVKLHCDAAQTQIRKNCVDVDLTVWAKDSFTHTLSKSHLLIIGAPVLSVNIKVTCA